MWLHDAVDRLLISGTSFKYHGKLHRREDYARLIEETAFEAVEFVKGKLGRIGVYDSVVLMGGGAGLYQHALTAAFAGIPVELIAEGRFANVRGFQLIAERQAKK